MSGADKGSISRRLVEFLWSADFGARDVEVAKSLLIDHLGVAAWGSHLQAGQIMRSHAVNDLDQGEPRIPIIGTQYEASALAASMANSVAACAYEFDDTHTAGSVHPGAVIFPASMAASRIAGCDSETFIRAVIIGYEVMCRVARAAGGPAHRSRHFHPTSTTGHFGASAAAAICLGLDIDKAVAALSLAGTMAGGSMQFLVEGAWAKQVQPAFALQRGVQGAQLAERGFPGLADPIAGERAFLAAQSASPRPERILHDLGTADFEVHNTGIKPYPSCRNTQSPLDALFAATARADLDPDSIELIEFGLIEPGVQTVFDPASAKRRPKSLVEAQFSMPFVAAVAVLDGEVTPTQFDERRFSDPRVLQLADRVVCIHDPELDDAYPTHWPSWARITTADGRVLEGRAEDPKGDPANPMTRADLVSKFNTLTAATYSGDRQRSIVNEVEKLGGTRSLDHLLMALQLSER